MSSKAFATRFPTSLSRTMTLRTRISQLTREMMILGFLASKALKKSSEIQTNLLTIFSQPTSTRVKIVVVNKVKRAKRVKDMNKDSNYLAIDRLLTQHLLIKRMVLVLPSK